MRIKIIGIGILTMIALGAIIFNLQRKATPIPSQGGSDENQTLTCPEGSFSLENRTAFAGKFLSFSAPVFATPISSPMRSKLCLLEKPTIGASATLLYKFKSERSASNVAAKIELPESFVLVSGNPEWRGSLMQNEEKSFEIVVQSTKTGYFQLKASAFQKEIGHEFGDIAAVYIEITSDNVVIDSEPKNM